MPPLPPAELPAPARLVAIGDIHGDLSALRAALRLGGAIDASDHWSGGELVVIQAGDVLDRGDDEPEILALLARLEEEAGATGGRMIVLNGNHEVMNAAGDFRYVTPDGLHDYDSFAERAAELPAAARRGLSPRALGRAIAFMPGSAIARSFAAHATAIRVGSSVFVHGGITPAHAERGLQQLNEDVRRFLLGEARLPRRLGEADSPFWHRAYALSDDAATCAQLARALERLGAARMVVGHTVQEHGITSACDGQVYRIDVGLARHYGGPLQVLEIRGDGVRTLSGSR